MRCVLLQDLRILANPSAKQYILKAHYAALTANLKHLMDAEDIYCNDNGSYFPERGAIQISKGERKEIPELNFTFPEGHKHRYILYGYNYSSGSYSMKYYYVMVYSDLDFNKNGINDMYILITYIRNGEMIYNRRMLQYW